MVEIQPFKYQKDTNIDEHNQMVDKINEIVDVINDSDLEGLAGIESRVDSLEDDLSAVGSTVASQGASISALESDVQTIPDVSQFITETEADTRYQPKGSYLTSVPIGGTAIGGVKNGGNVTINADGTMDASGGVAPTRIHTDTKNNFFDELFSIFTETKVFNISILFPEGRFVTGVYNYHNNDILTVGNFDDALNVGIVSDVTINLDNNIITINQNQAEDTMDENGMFNDVNIIII